jgi:hypothetical protein
MSPAAQRGDEVLQPTLPLPGMASVRFEVGLPLET